MEEKINNEQETTNDAVRNYEEVEIKKKEVRTDSYFDGGLLELIGWRILAILITAITFGIAAPWAKCMLYSYQIKHTVYNGKRLKFEGTGGELFVNIFKWIFFSIITLGIYIFVIPVRKTKWVISNIHFEDEEFVKDESFFDGSTIGLIGVNFLCHILTIISLGILYPFTVCYRLKWINKHTVINRKRISFNGKAINLFGKYILWMFLTIITFGIYGLWLTIKMLKWQSKNTHIKVVGEENSRDSSILIAIIIAVLIILMVGPAIPHIISNLEKNKTMESFKNNISTLLNNGELSSKELKNYSNNSMDEKYISIPQTTTVKGNTKKTSTTENKAKTSIKVGGYTLKFGKYTGTVLQFDWEKQKEIKTKITLVLSENKITVNGISGKYSTKGNKITWNGDSYLLEVLGNNQIRYNAETCPVLKYQGK